MKKYRDYFLISLLGAMLFIPFLGRVHLFDWDEINFAESAREMIVTNDFAQVQINFQPFWEKPPLFMWMQAASMKVFGVNEFAARFPNAIIGIITLLVVFSIGKKLFDRRMGVLWAMTYACTFLPAFYFRSGIIDPTFNLFIFLGVYFFTQFISSKENQKQKKSWQEITFSAFFIGLAVLTKGPVAMLVFALCFLVYSIINFKKIKIFLLQYLWFAILLSAISLIWILLVISTSGVATMKEFFDYQIRLLTTGDAGHSGFLFYHWVVLLVGCFPASLLLIYAFRKNKNLNAKQIIFKQWMQILFWVVLVLFTIVKTKIIHYSSLCWFPLTFLAAYVLWNQVFEKQKIHRAFTIALTGIGILIGLILVAVPIVGQNINWIFRFANDQRTILALQAKVSWNYFECLIGIVFLVLFFYGLYFIVKKKDLLSGYFLLFVSSLITVQLVAVDFVPKVEKYSQGAVIEFYESLQGKDVYADADFYKSYAHLFYMKKPHQPNLNSYNMDWLRRGKIDKPAYFVIPSVYEKEFEQVNDAKLLFSKNGFSFYERLPE